MALIDTTPNQAASGKGAMTLSLVPKRLGAPCLSSNVRRQHTLSVMNTQPKPCRNCGSTEFYTGDAARTVAITLFTIPPKFHLRVCGICGLLDWFLPEQDLQKLKKNFTPEKL